MTASRIGEVYAVEDVALTDLAGAWATDQWAGYWLVPNWNVPRIFRVLGNSANKLFVVRDHQGEGLRTVTGPRAYYALLDARDAQRYQALVQRAETFVPADTKLLWYFEGPGLAIIGAPYFWEAGALGGGSGGVAGLLFERALTDAATLADHVVQGGAVIRTLTDALVVTDAASRGKQRNLTLSDTASATDNLVRAVPFVRTASDSAAVTDGVARGRQRDLLLSDSADLTDGAGRGYVNARSSSDSALLTDASTLSLAFARTLTDTASATDDAAAVIS